MSTLKRGRIVYVRVLDRQGRNPKRRPVILLSQPDDLALDEPLTGVAVSTQPKEPLPFACVRLPSNRRRQGASRLPERCAAVCDWPVQFFRRDIEEIGGMVYGELLMEIMEKAKPFLEEAQPPYADEAEEPPTDETMSPE